MSSAHLFFLYAGLSLDDALATAPSFSLASPDLAHRVYTVLRLRPGEHVQLFSDAHVATLTLTASPRPKHLITGMLQTVTRIAPAPQKITAAIGLLKKESFEEAVHHATVTGAHAIAPLITEKSRRGWLHEREPERLRTLITAAAEQAKNPRIPQLLNPIRLTDLSKQPPSVRIGFDAASTHTMHEYVHDAALISAPEVCVFIGPEGGFTEQELQHLTAQGTTFYRLTSTILRTQEATCVALGLLNVFRPDDDTSSF